MFSKKATGIEYLNIHRWFETYLVNVKSMVKISSIFVAFVENMNFNDGCHLLKNYLENSLYLKSVLFICKFFMW